MIAKTLKWMVMILVIGLIAIQLVRPARTNPPVDESKSVHSQTQISPQVAAIFERACNDCHSNETRWPWYSQIAPVSWFVADHVHHGRKHLNFSEWGNYEPRQLNHKLDEIELMINHDMMPLASYLWVHRDAELSTADKQALRDWVRAERERLSAPTDR